MTSLLTRAFGVGSDQIQGPKWLTDFSGMVYYNVNATMPPGTTKEEFQKMLQNLLIERFHLAVRRETRNFPGYDLVVDKGGPKFHEVTPEPSPGAVDSRTMVRADRGADGFPITTGPRTMSRSTASGMQRTKYQERSMAEFVSNLGFLIGSSQGKGVLDGNLQPRVVDKTGLTGKYTFILEYFDATDVVLRAAVGMQPAAGTGDAAPAVASDPGSGVSIFTAIQKQLGLRLDKAADVPLDVIVILSVDKTPTPD
jgi:uncharacterized protein (TIGR03435 family)